MSRGQFNELYDKCIINKKPLRTEGWEGREGTVAGSVGATLLRESDVPSPSQREESSDSIPSTLSAPLDRWVAPWLSNCA